MTLDGADVFLLGNGYAPVITVRDGTGNVLYRQATPFLAQDNNYTSVGRDQGRRGAARADRVQRLLPADRRADLRERARPRSSPTDSNPELALSVWEGDLYPGERPQSVYTLDTAELKPS